MLTEIFKERVRNLVTPQFEECAERTRGAYSRRSAELAARGHVYSGATLMAQHDARVTEKQEQIDIVWGVLSQVATAQQLPYSETLAEDLKAELEYYASYQMSGIQRVEVRKGDERIERQFQEDFEAKRLRKLNRIKAEIDVFVDNLRAALRVARTDTKELDQKFRLLLSPNQAKADFEGWTEELRKKNKALGLVFIDIDYFKPLNAKYTHATIDRTVLPEFMTLLQDCVEFRGGADRYGGEEFIVILPNHRAEEAMGFAENLRSEFERHAFSVDGGEVHITVSVGVATWPSHGLTYSEVLQKANAAEGVAKLQRNKVALAE